MCNWKLEDHIGDMSINNKPIKQELANAVISKVVEKLHRTSVLQKITNTMKSYN